MNSLRSVPRGMVARARNRHKVKRPLKCAFKQKSYVVQQPILNGRCRSRPQSNEEPGQLPAKYVTNVVAPEPAMSQAYFRASAGNCSLDLMAAQPLPRS